MSNIMIKNMAKSIFSATSELTKAWRSLLIFAGLYALLLAVLYGFIATREATIRQVVLTLFFAASAPVIFFLLQATIINRARSERIEWYRALRDSCKLALLALPVILAGLTLASLTTRWQNRFPAQHCTPPVMQRSVEYPDAPPKPAVTTPPRPMHWPTFMFGTLRLLLFGLVLPLMLIQLWIEFGSQDLIKLIRHDARSIFRKLRDVCSNAFAPQSVLTYSMGLILFALVPYLLLFVRTPLKGTRSDIGIFATRLALVFVFTLFGWVATLTTFAKRNEVAAIDNQEPDAEECA